MPLAQGFDEVFYPGEVEDRAEAANRAAGGVALAEQSLADLLGSWARRPGSRSLRRRQPMTAARRAPGRASKVDLVHRRLKEEIELGELPGTPLSELWLVERTGASRTPVREALRRLAAEGLVDLVPRQGARVSRVSLQSVRDLFEFRALLEPEAIRQATEAAAADPELRRAFASLRTEFARVQRRALALAVAGLLRRADRFDWAIIGATRNEHLRRTIAELRPHTARLRNLSHVDPQRVEVSVAEHLRMCDALLAGDADEAAAAAPTPGAEPGDDLPQPRRSPGDGPRPPLLSRHNGDRGAQEARRPSPPAPGSWRRAGCAAPGCR